MSPEVTHRRRTGAALNKSEITTVVPTEGRCVAASPVRAFSAQCHRKPACQHKLNRSVNLEGESTRGGQSNLLSVFVFRKKREKEIRLPYSLAVQLAVVCQRMLVVGTGCDGHGSHISQRRESLLTSADNVRCERLAPQKKSKREEEEEERPRADLKNAVDCLDQRLGADGSPHNWHRVWPASILQKRFSKKKIGNEKNVHSHLAPEAVRRHFAG